jgi:sec-independent protein translocase protein TatC
LSFFLFYIVDVLEPLGSFKEYFDFVLVLYLSSIYIFQLPVIQLIFGVLGLCNAKLYFSYLKYIVLIATVVSAIFTPSTDPVTQIIFAGAILILYLLGAGLVFYFEKYKIIY